jgi:GT2 family glycosyltransferase
VIPTLRGGEPLRACLDSLARQSFQDFQVIVVKNHPEAEIPAGTPVLNCHANIGYGAAINEGARGSSSPMVMALNDDTVLEPECLERMVRAMEADTKCAMVAPRILLGDTGRLDSAGMLLARDGSSKQRGHGDEEGQWERSGETLLPSGCAALYRRAALEEAGGFDGSLFLYCEETDLGLRLLWLGWNAAYEAGARLRHRYSETAGRASLQKAWYVERNRLRVAVKTLPWRWVAASFLFSLIRYAWHLAALWQGRGKAGEFRSGGGSGWRLAWVVLKAHWAMLAALPNLLRQRHEVMRKRRITPAQFEQILERHRIPLREVAAQ